jgi:cytoskeletal protein CcmA (bactofilin family)
MTDYKDPPPNDFFIGSGVIFKGEAKVPNKAVINGDFSGLLDAQELEIQSNGVITGNTNADDIKVFGKLNSELTCRNLLAIESSGVVRGKLQYGKIEVARGGKVIGNISYK